MLISVCNNDACISLYIALSLFWWGVFPFASFSLSRVGRCGRGGEGALWAVRALRAVWGGVGGGGDVGGGGGSPLGGERVR